MRLKSLLILSISLIVFSCKNDNKKQAVKIPKEIPFIDTDLDKFTPLQLYSQHIIFTIPTELQNNIDSLMKWIKITQPGGLIFKNWDIQNIQNLHQSIDTLDMVQPFILDNYWRRINSSKYHYSKANSELGTTKFKQVFYQSGINLLDFDNYKDSVEMDNYYYSIHHHFPTVKKKKHDMTTF